MVAPVLKLKQLSQYCPAVPLFPNAESHRLLHEQEVTANSGSKGELQSARLWDHMTGNTIVRTIPSDQHSTTDRADNSGKTSLNTAEKSCSVPALQELSLLS